MRHTQHRILQSDTSGNHFLKTKAADQSNGGGGLTLTLQATGNNKGLITKQTGGRGSVNNKTSRQVIISPRLPDECALQRTSALCVPTGLAVPHLLCVSTCMCLRVCFFFSVMYSRSCSSCVSIKLPEFPLCRRLIVSSEPLTSSGMSCSLAGRPR